MVNLVKRSAAVVAHIKHFPMSCRDANLKSIVKYLFITTTTVCQNKREHDGHYKWDTRIS